MTLYELEQKIGDYAGIVHSSINKSVVQEIIDFSKTLSYYQNENQYFLKHGLKYESSTKNSAFLKYNYPTISFGHTIFQEDLFIQPYSLAW